MTYIATFDGGTTLAFQLTMTRGKTDGISDTGATYIAKVEKSSVIAFPPVFRIQKSADIPCIPIAKTRKYNK